MFYSPFEFYYESRPFISVKIYSAFQLFLCHPYKVADLIVNAMTGRHKMEREGMEKKEDLLDKLDEIWMEE
jgi:hypothetical protein